MVPCEAVLMFISDNSVCSEGVEVSREVRNISSVRPYLLKAHRINNIANASHFRRFESFFYTLPDQYF